VNSKLEAHAMATVTTTGRAKKTRPPAPPTPDGILQLGLCFWGSKTLLSPIELGLYVAAQTLLGSSTKLYPSSRRSAPDNGAFLV
jgi:hypothetical protein